MHHAWMRFSINIPNFGDFADPRTVAVVAAEAAVRAKLAICQQGVGKAASTMTPFQLTSTVFPAANLVFEHWQDGTAPGQFSTFDLSSHTLSEGYNESWTYTFSLDRWQ